MSSLPFFFATLVHWLWILILIVSFSQMLSAIAPALQCILFHFLIFAFSTIWCHDLYLIFLWLNAILTLWICLFCLEAWKFCHLYQLPKRSSYLISFSNTCYPSLTDLTHEKVYLLLYFTDLHYRFLSVLLLSLNYLFSFVVHVL